MSRRLDKKRKKQAAQKVAHRQKQADSEKLKEQPLAQDATPAKNPAGDVLLPQAQAEAVAAGQAVGGEKPEDGKAVELQAKTIAMPVARHDVAKVETPKAEVPKAVPPSGESRELLAKSEVPRASTQDVAGNETATGNEEKTESVGFSKNAETQEKKAALGNENKGGSKKSASVQNATSAQNAGKQGGQTAVVAKPASTPKSAQRKKPKKRSVAGIVIASMLKFVFVIFCFVVMGISIAAVQVSQYMAEATVNDAESLDLDNLKLNLTSYIMAPNPNNPRAEAEGDYIKYQELTGPQHRIWVEWKDIPENLVNAIIAIEDRDFESHHGVSFRRSAMAALNMVFAFEDKEFGASTIEQQLVKNLTGDDETDYKRKLREMFRAWGLDSRYSKETIMEAYLNTISLSGTIAGVQAGAQDYFGKNVWELDLAESATIAGITRAPGYYDPYTNPQNCQSRRNKVLYQMRLIGKITDAEYEAARAEPLGVKNRTNTSDGLVTNSTFSYFSDAVFNDVIEDLMKEYGYTRSAATHFVYTAGLSIESTVDIKLQSSMEDIFERGYEDTEDAFFTNLKDPSSGRLYKQRLGVREDILNEEGAVVGSQEVLPQAAMTTIDYTGAIRGVVGGIGEKSGDLQLNRATQSPRQVGSTMKPVAAYSLAIDQGLVGYSSMVMDSGVQPRDPLKPRRDGEIGGIINDWPKNFSQTYRNTTMPVVSAIAESTNTVAVRVGMRVGIEPMYDFLVDTLEISSLVGEGPVNDLGPSALILGGLTHGITTAELAGAYQMFGGGGAFNSVHTYTRVLDSKGNVILKPEVSHVQAISPEAAYVVNRMLWTVLRNGTAPGVYSTASRMALEGAMDSVAKTGTTSDDVDRWFVGLTPYYVTAVWWGYDNPKYDFNRKWSPVATGNIPPLLWKSIMEKQQEGMPLKEFPEMPEGVLEDYFCAVTGERAGGGCPRGGVGYFIPEVRPAAYCRMHG